MTISISLPDDVLAALDAIAGGRESRSAVIERVLREHVARNRDLATLNERADLLNAEAADTLEYQAPWSGE